MQITIRLYGEERLVELEDGDTILTTAMRAGMDPPFSCQLGACSTCRAKLIEGTVRMDANDVLTESEVSEGYILTCQSHPTSERIVVDYDM